MWGILILNPSLHFYLYNNQKIYPKSPWRSSIIYYPVVTKMFPKNEHLLLMRTYTYAFTYTISCCYFFFFIVSVQPENVFCSYFTGFFLFPKWFYCFCRINQFFLLKMFVNMALNHVWLLLKKSRLLTWHELNEWILMFI